MTIKPIRTQADHTAALREIERLWDARERTPQADRLEVLVALGHPYADWSHRQSFPCIRQKSADPSPSTSP